ncbi:MAG: glutaminyl-peptide cyclotransferase [Planctomycetaceae bacterium]|nr:glutaminyl-peptide cyclotransferase [Planctomycetaceae bacterium]
MKHSIYPPLLLFCLACCLTCMAGYSILSSGCFGAKKETLPDTNANVTQPDTGNSDTTPPTKPDDSPVIELPVQLKLSLVAVHPHDAQAFTQGLEFYKGKLYESTGHYSRSTLRLVEIATGKVLQQHSLARQYFGEGITLFGDKIYQLTWQEKTCFVYDRETFRQEKTFTYPGEGWGLTNDGTHLMMSDGSPRIRFLNPDTFQPVRVIDVRDGNKRVTQINELEYIHGEIWANMLGSKYIVRINPADGRVIGWINCTNFVPKEISPNDPENVLNGIAFDAETNRVYITGKHWPVLYELQLNE